VDTKNETPLLIYTGWTQKRNTVTNIYRVDTRNVDPLKLKMPT